MRRNGNDRDLALSGTVAPKNAVSARRAILSICLEHLRFSIVGVFDGVVFVCIQARVAGVLLEKQHALYDLFEQAFLPGSFGLPGLLPIVERLLGCRFKLAKSIRCTLEPNQCEGHQSPSRPASFAAFFRSGGCFATLPLRASSRPRRTEAKALGFS